jgi:hypothetical protein
MGDTSTINLEGRLDLEKVIMNNKEKKENGKENGR